MKKVFLLIIVAALAWPLTAQAVDVASRSSVSRPTTLRWKNSSVPVTFHQRTVRSTFRR
jgi:hypothetical protein